MTNNPLVSIVLPTYNGSRYLDQAIQSILNQTYQNWELIIVDDGSTDETPSIISRYTMLDPRVRSIRHPTNRRLPAALNTGFAHAKGKYLTWTSDDNYYRPNAIATMVVFLENHPEVDIVYADWTIIDENGNVIGYRKVGHFTELVHRNCIGPCFLYRREVQEKVGNYSEQFFLAEDYDFWLRAATHSFQFCPLHVNLYCYRIHNKSLSKSKRENIEQVRDRVLFHNVYKIPWLDTKSKAKIYFKLAQRAYNSRRNISKMSKCLLIAFICDPSILLHKLKQKLLMTLKRSDENW